MRRFLALTVALWLVPAIASAGVPAVTTGEATNRAPSSITLTATVNPSGEATTVRFHYGTTDAYGTTSKTRQVRAGTTDVDVAIPVSGLAPSTTYHYRAVANNASGTVQAGDRTFTTTGPAPGAGTGGVRDVGATAATLTGTVTPRGEPTIAYFRYGDGLRTPDIQVGSGTDGVAVSATITGLSPSTRYVYQLHVQAASGASAVGRSRGFTTAARVTGASLSFASNPVPYGGTLAVAGRLSGAAPAGTAVAVEVRPFPFSGAWRQVGPDKVVAGDGRYRFTVPFLLTTSKVRVVTRSGDRIVVSGSGTAFSAMRVGLLAPQRRRGGSVVLRGAVRPATAGATASLQRRAPNGKWVRVARQAVSVVAGKARYRFVLRRPSRSADVRVVVAPNDGGAHVPGVSRARFVSRRG
jgi:hypothetical protein